jgi:release factor glutamine methyltransferase
MSATAPITAGSSIASVLAGAHLDAVDARVLTCHALGLTKVQLITRSDTLLDAAQAERLARLFARRQAGEPVAYIVGMREFFGLEFEVTPDVLIPRPDTELLVELALERLPQGARVLDMGTGSGAIPVALAHTRPDLQVCALDISAGALQVAGRNAQRHGVHISFLQSDWFSALASEQFDVIVANPPYIIAGDAHLMRGDLRFEPLGALTDHADGLSALRRIIAGAPDFLASHGWLLVEHGYHQAEDVRNLLNAQGMQSTQSWRDLADIERVSGARRP